MIEPKNILSKEEALQCYKDLILPRRIERRMLNLLRQNKISKWFSGIGQEAIAVGVTRALKHDDVIMSMHRNLGVFTTRKVPYYPLFCQLFGKKDGFTGGRERSFHFGLQNHHIVGMISHLGAMLPVGTGIALALKMRKENRVVVAFTGDGSTSEGDFHEAINLAAVWKLPVIFLIENNGYGLSTPVNEQYACTNLSDRAIGYGIKGVTIDGNNILTVEKTIKALRKKVQKEGPVLVEAKTFRMRGHEEASGTAYVPQILLDEWAQKDPISIFENFLLEHHICVKSELLEIENATDDEFNQDLMYALESSEPEFDEQEQLNRVYAVQTKTKEGITDTQIKDIRYIDGIRNALIQSFTEDDNTLIFGQDIAEYGGVFKVTEGFVERFGKNRVRNTPIIESGIIGAAYGMALEGYRPIVEMQFADFISCGFNQIINNLAKSHYRWSDSVNVTIRAPHGAGVGAGPFHSVSPEAWFMQHPGLKVVVPATVRDAQILLYSAIHDPNPVLVFEHKRLYRSIKGISYTTIPLEVLGNAQVVREGTDFTIITYGMGVHWAVAVCEKIEHEKNRYGEVLDLRCLLPLDYESIKQTVVKTGRVLLLQEASMFMGPMSEIAAFIAEHCFEKLDAPLLRCSSLDTPVPTNRNLESGFLADSRLYQTLVRLLNY